MAKQGVRCSMELIAWLWIWKQIIPLKASPTSVPPPNKKARENSSSIIYLHVLLLQNLIYVVIYSCTWLRMSFQVQACVTSLMAKPCPFYRIQFNRLQSKKCICYWCHASFTIPDFFCSFRISFLLSFILKHAACGVASLYSSLCSLERNLISKMQRPEAM